MNRSAARRNAPADLLMNLEPRQMLAGGFNFIDADGDEVTVTLKGDGTVNGTINAGVLEFLTLAGATAKSTLSISVKRGAGDGRTPLGGMSVAELASMKAPAVDLLDGASVEVNALSALTLGHLADGSTVDVEAAAGKAMTLVFGNILDGAVMLIAGSVKSLKAASVGDTADVEASTTISAITVTGNMGGEWSATNFGKITVGGQFRARMNASLPDAKGYSFGAIKAASANGAGLSHPFQTDAGRIKSITIAGSWTLGGILAAGIDTLKVNGDFLPTSVNLSEVVDVPFSIKTGSVGGTMNGLFILAGPVGTLKIGNVGGSLAFDAVGDRVDVKTLTFTGTADVFGEFQFDTIGTLSAPNARLGGLWDLTGENAKGLSIASIKALHLDEFDTTEFTPGGIGSIAVAEMDDCSIVAQFFGKITVKARGAGDGLIDESVFTATGTDAAGYSFKSVSASGGIDETRFQSAGNVDKFSARFFTESDLFVGLLNPLQEEHPDFTNFNDFNGTGLINRFTLTGPFEPQGPVLEESHVVAATIANIKINGATQTDEGGVSFGFGARTFGSVTMKDPLGKTFKPVIPGGPGVINPFLPADSDFVFRVYAV